jgi:beta-phosphoglucomutase-like phosphatase (HAD superfamily)
MTGKLLIFDCDGVLVDSEPISINLMIKYCSKSGLRISHEEAYECFLGKPVADAHEIRLEKTRGTPFIFTYSENPAALAPPFLQAVVLFLLLSYP